MNSGCKRNLQDNHFSKLTKDRQNIANMLKGCEVTIPLACGVCQKLAHYHGLAYVFQVTATYMFWAAIKSRS